MTIVRAALVISAAIALWTVSPGGGSAEESAKDYPSRPVTFVVPFAPGGSTGLIARIIGQKLEQRLGKPFIIDHRAGGGGLPAVNAVAHGTPDGYTIMMASSTALAINVNVRKSLPYDPRKDITPIALIARMPYVLVVNPELPVQSVADLVKLAREKPGELTFASPGPGTIHHLNGELFKSMFGLNVVHVPYKGTMPALQDVAGGHVQFMFADVPPAKALVLGGKVRALGVTTLERVQALPDLPPLSEVGMPGYDTASWHSISTGAGVPKDIVDKLANEIREVMKEPEVQHLLAEDGAIPQLSPPPEEFKKFVDSEITRWGGLVEKAGILHSQ
ncbi:Bug family tripartite tricarboxylate transporter substrate binding protein [Rhodoplanes sp. Z2-YC6860]|uniref:Bug family tripartite tricarboxylate transporter substrate binding protein n=1 Tax=Rhodoplanes sp. Z2-YC6860 TaxID=674703 RepID=UPI00078EA5CD|nr:tripartite tricarboxylate transporter substrate binding protein [Rhodoplanes sp. Z2-YC6860]AMN44283.1 extra-cytoplasmic solute receptor protein [Rhodoplanes sp. Z2-YC6860]